MQMIRKCVDGLVSVLYNAKCKRFANVMHRLNI